MILLDAAAQALHATQRNTALLTVLICLVFYAIYKISKPVVVNAMGWYDFGDLVKAQGFQNDPLARINADADGNIIGWNDAAEYLLIWKEKEVIGKPLTIIIPEELRAKHLEGMRRFRLTREARVIGKSLEMPALRKDGQQVPVKLLIGTAKVKDRVVYYGTMQDMTEKVKEREDLHEEVRMLEYAERLADHGSYIWNFQDGGTVRYSKNFDYVFEWATGEKSKEAFIRQVHPDDKPKLMRAIASLRERKEGYTLDYRAYGRAGAIHTYQSITEVIKDADGNIQFIVGVFFRIR